MLVSFGWVYPDPVADTLGIGFGYRVNRKVGRASCPSPRYGIMEVLRNRLSDSRK